MAITVSPAAEPRRRDGASQTRARAAREAGVETRGWHLLCCWIGLALAIVSLANLALVWWTPQWGDAQWEFFTVNQTVERFPLLVLSLGLIGVGAVVGQSVWATRLVATAFLLGAVVVAGLFVMYGLSLAVAFGLNSAPAEVAVLRRGALKGSVVLTTYGVLFVSLAVGFWRRARRG